VVKKIKPVVEKVKFKQMKEGSKEDYLLLNKLEKKFIEGFVYRQKEILRVYLKVRIFFSQPNITS